MAPKFLTSQEEVILITVGLLQPDAYAYSIKKELKSEAGVSISLPTIHTILYRMEKQKLLQSGLGGSSEKRGGRSNRLYKLTHKGYGVIKEIQSVRNMLWTKLQIET
jgi:DNA-binding PadR family transcriptional regulator